MIRDPIMKGDVAFLSRRSFLLFLEAICISDGIKTNDSLRPVATNVDVRRYLVKFL